MTALLAPGICRFAVNGTFSGRAVVNIVDMRINTTGSTVSRGDACDAQAGIIINEWTDSILPTLNSKYTARSVSWVDLDSLSGTVGERSTTSAATWPQVGGSGDDAVQGNVAFRVNKNTSAGRGSRQGRMYLAGVGESANQGVSPNQLEPLRITNWNTSLASFLGDINQAATGIMDYTSDMVVVHTVDKVFTSASDVSSLTMDATFGSQRRRLRG